MPTPRPPRLLPLLLSLAVTAIPGVAEPLQDDPPADEVVLGKPSSIRSIEEPVDTVLVTIGTRLYRLPDRRSTLLDVLGFDAPRPVLEQAEGWVMIRAHGQAGWVAVADGRTGPDVESPPDPAILASRQMPLAPAPQRLERARTIVGDKGRDIGPFTLYSDLTDTETIERVVGVAAKMPATYIQRYGLEPSASDRFAIVVFAHEASYRSFEEGEMGLAGLETGGHSGGNVAVIFAEGLREGELESLLLHELTHLLNRSTFRATLPAWLEEGLAEDLSHSHVGPSGRIDPTRLGGADRRRLEFDRKGNLTYVAEAWGAPTALSKLVEAQSRGELIDLRDLLALSYREMVEIEGRALRYGLSAFFIRYLLEGAGENGRHGLRAFLRQAAGGGGTEPDDLAAWLGRDWQRLETDLHHWLALRSGEKKSRR